MKSITLSAIALPIVMSVIGCSGGVDEQGEVVGGDGTGTPIPDPNAGEMEPLPTVSAETGKLCGATRSDWVSTAHVHNGHWGNWGCVDWCPPSSFAYGIDMKSEWPQGSGDDTSVNAISLWCHNRFSGNHVEWVTSSQAPWGVWLGKGGIQCNAPSQPITSGRLRVEIPGGSGFDDTAANGIRYACLNNPSTELTAPANTNWGAWGSQVFCPPGPTGAAVCGIQTRVEGSQGSGDDTALNGVRFYCCSL